MPVPPLLALALLTAAPDEESQAGPPRPNVLFVMSDDHTTQAVGAYGSRLAGLNPTPTLDRLARGGMRFENAVCVNSICTPSRACILTGQYPHTNGVYDLTGDLAPEHQLLPTVMAAAGYQTAMIGKWHLKREPAAFDYYCVLPGQGEYFDPTFRVRGEKPWPQNTFRETGKHSTDAITDLTLDWLKNDRDPDRPFFLMHHYKAPHDFFEYAPRYGEYLADAEVPEPDNLWSQPRFGSIATRGADDELLPFIGTSIGRRNPRRNYVKHYGVDDALSDAAAKREAYDIYLKHYLRCVKGVDDNLARLFDHLDESGLTDDTLVIYTGDQGFMLGEHDYMDKRWMYEESLHMPLLMRYPGVIPAGTVTDAIVENVDFAPTMLDFAGATIPASMQGESFRTLCETGEEPDGWKQAAYYRYWMHMAHHDNPAHVGLRTKTHKLIYYYGCDYEGKNRTPPGWELYDLTADPTEVVNLYDDPAHADLVAELKSQLAALREHVGDTGEDHPAAERVVREFWDYDAADRARAVEISHDYRARAGS